MCDTSISEIDCEDILVKTLQSRRNRHGKNLIFIQVNVNSLDEKCDYFRDLLSRNMMDILCVTETKLCDDIIANDLLVDGYKLHRQDRNRNSGGIVV